MGRLWACRNLSQYEYLWELHELVTFLCKLIESYQKNCSVLEYSPLGTEYTDLESNGWNGLNHIGSLNSKMMMPFTFLQVYFSQTLKKEKYCPIRHLTIKLSFLSPMEIYLGPFFYLALFYREPQAYRWYTIENRLL